MSLFQKHVCPSVEKTVHINVTKCKYIFNKNLNNKLHSEIYYNDSIVISRNNIRKHYFTSSKSVVVEAYFELFPVITILLREFSRDLATRKLHFIVIP